MQQKNSKHNILKNSLRKVLDQENLKLHQQLIKQLSAELQVNTLDCAAALLVLNEPDLFDQDKHVKNILEVKAVVTQVPAITKIKLVRYRLDIGRKHAVTVEQIRQILVEISGVDKNRIGKLDIRNYYTLVDLPDGMPADIFQLLSEAEINQQRFNIKRVKYQARFYRRNNKKYSAKANLV